jgi:hypothetical protein
MRIAANAFAALLATASAAGTCWFATPVFSTGGTWTDVAGALACMAGFLGAGALAIPRRWR